MSQHHEKLRPKLCGTFASIALQATKAHCTEDFMIIDFKVAKSLLAGRRSIPPDQSSQPLSIDERLAQYCRVGGSITLNDMCMLLGDMHYERKRTELSLHLLTTDCKP